ncbi:MAG: hypothetical protein FWG39_03760 [Alphaproteobacteria bacterium]|nr:hypothetical protein [Alphaproteobacteria bacterium]
MKIKTLFIGILCGFSVSAYALSLPSVLGGNAKVSEVAGKVVEAISPEEQVKKLIDKCTTPTTDGICECVANAIVANLTPEQWKIVNHHLFDARRSVSTSEFLLKNPWIIPKLAAPYAKCSDKK